MLFNHDTKHEALIVKDVSGKFKRGVDLKRFKNEKQKRKELAIIVASKAILQKNVTRRNKIGRTNFKVFHK
jgi:hypothetical protein